MGGLERTITPNDLTRSGALRSRDLELIRVKLVDQGGFVLAPSDTCYSVAMVPWSKETRDQINAMLSRPPNWPVSVAFRSIAHAKQHVRMSMAVVSLLEKYTPGPLTVVCPSNPTGPGRDFAYSAVGSSDATIGVRIPDSILERELAGLHAYGVTSVAVRDRAGHEVRDLLAAMQLIHPDATLSRKSGWIAIQGDDSGFSAQHSTVIRVGKSGGLDVLRPGDIAEDDIRAALDSLPSMAFRYE